MNFRVRFLDGSANVIAEWIAYAHSARGPIELTEGLDLADAAVRMQIVDESGREVYATSMADNR